MLRRTPDCTTVHQVKTMRSSKNNAKVLTGKTSNWQVTEAIHWTYLVCTQQKLNTRAVVRRCSIKKLFFKLSQNS